MVYSALAAIYDRVMAHVEYADWVELIQRIVDRYAVTPKPSVYEIGGGTGVLAELLACAGYDHVGSDLSLSMCRRAVRRGQSFVCTDGRSLPVKTTFDLVLFLYDGINYLGSRPDYDMLFREVHRCLEPNGLFLFDITTEANSRRYFSNFVDSQDLGNAAYIRHSYYDEISRLQHNDFVVFLRDPEDQESWRRFDEHHVQRVLPAATINGWIPDDLFEVIGIFDGFSLRRYGRNSERIHFLLRARELP